MTAVAQRRTAPLDDARPLVQIVEIETTQPLPDLSIAGAARLLVRVHGRPVAFEPVQLPAGGWRAAQVREVVDRVLAEAPTARRTRPAHRPTVSVVITTCDADRGVRRVLDCVRRQTRTPYEVIVVDNRPATSGVRDLLADERFPHVRLVAEPRRGVSFARNAGLAAAQGDVVVFTDDDVILDEHWVEAIADAFTDEQVACVTGLVLPMQLETRAQVLFEEYGGFAKGFRRRVFDLDTHRDPGPLYPYAAGVFGTGANSAFRTGVLRTLGGFDTRLGTTVTRGGEDLDVLLTVVVSGHVLVYEPAALVRHHHHRSMRELRRQVFNYGAGISAMLTTRCLRSPAEAGAIIRRVLFGLRHLLSARSPKNSHKSRHYPVHLNLLELAGFTWGIAAATWTMLRPGGRRA